MRRIIVAERSFATAAQPEVFLAGNQIKLPQIGIIQIRAYLRRPGVYRCLKQYC
jgi:hypothetical protein